MPVYKLTYFKGRGRAEVPRMLFTMAGQEFQDIRLEGESWQEFKPKTPMGQLPVLEVDDVIICQSNAVSRFVANKFGFAGKTDLDKARADMVVDCMDDMAKPLITVFSAKSDEEKAAIKTKFTTEQAPEFLTKLEKIFEQNNNGDGWFVGDDITWADVQFYNVIDFPESQMGLSIGLDKFKKLSALKKRVEDHPKIQEWIAKRP